MPTVESSAKVAALAKANAESTKAANVTVETADALEKLDALRSYHRINSVA